MNTVIRARGPEDVVAYIPYGLGFRPRESVVLVALRPPRQQIGVVLRLDVAALADEDHGHHALAEARELLARDGADDALVVLYTDVPGPLVTTDPVLARAVSRLRQETRWCARGGPWVVGARFFGVWGAGRGDPLTRPVAELDYGAMAATLVLNGRAVAADRSDLAVLPAGDGDRRRAALRAFHAERRRCPQPAAERQAWREKHYRHWLRLVSRSRRGTSVPAAEVGRLLAGLGDVLVRDGVLCSVIGRPTAALPTPATVSRVLDEAFRPGAGAPDGATVERAASVLRQMVAAVPGRPGAPALGMLAWLAWWSGDSAGADVLSRQCLTVGPSHRLARLVQDAVGSHLPPGWVRAARPGLGGHPRSGSIR